MTVKTIGAVTSIVIKGTSNIAIHLGEILFAALSIHDMTYTPIKIGKTVEE